MTPVPILLKKLKLAAAVAAFGTFFFASSFPVLFTLVLDDKLWISLAVVKHNKLPKAISSRLRYNTVVPDKQDQSQSRP